MTAERWSSIASFLTMTGSVAWLAKFAVIVGTDGRVVDTGVAAWFLRLGVVGLMLGASGFAVWFTRRRHRLVRLIGVLLAPIAFFASFLLVDSIAKAAIGTRGPAYLPAEAGIAATAIVWFILGLWLMFTLRRAERPIGTHTTTA